jgi:2-polyprenyl-3-methyl-5-hydroxy-6-metoxy-1,4-benzoquinol methylase
VATDLKRAVRRAAKRVVTPATHAIGRLRGSYYFEDYIRVYPGGVAYNRLGLRRRPTRADLNNFRNHMKVYEFAAQFVAGKRVADIGCGSGFGCKILKEAGAVTVHGTDISNHAVRYAKMHFGAYADFARQTIVDLHEFPDAFFDVVVSSEVLEHIKEYGHEDRALAELERIVRPGGLVLVGTPNSELLGDHGFWFHEIDALFRDRFAEFRIFENALVPFDEESRRAWEERLAKGRTGVIVTEDIDLSETVLPPGVRPELKRGLDAGEFDFAGYKVDTRLLHNTHGWLVLAKKGER